MIRCPAPYAQVAALVATVVLVAGCGSSDRLEYERDLARAGRTVDDALERQETGAGRHEPQDAEDIAQLAGDLREAAEQVQDLDPPADAVKAQARLVDGLRGVAAAYDDLAADLRAADDDKARAELFVRFTTDPAVDDAFEDLEGAHSAYLREGYRVFGTAPEEPAAEPVVAPAAKQDGATP